MIYFKDNIKILRKKAGLTQGNIADLLGVKANTISNYEQGVSSPDIASLEKLVNILDVNIHSLLFEDLSIYESEKFNTKTPEKAYKLNVGENVGFPKLQKKPTNNIASDVPVIYDADIKTLTSLVDVEKVIPLYNMIPVDGLDDLFKQSLTPSSYISLPHLPKCDGAIYNQSKNMSPDIERGDIIVYKVVKNHNDSIIFGKTCLLSLELGGCEHVTLNEIGESAEEGHISLISRDGQRPQDVPLDSIDEIAIVAANLRYRSLI